MFRRSGSRSAFAALAVTVAFAVIAPVLAQPFQAGDVVAARQACPGCDPGVSLKWFSSSGAPIKVTQFLAYSLAISAGELWVSSFDGWQQKGVVIVLDASGNVSRQYTQPDIPDIAATANGELVLAGSHSLRIVDRHGAILREFPPGIRGPIDVAPDNCTLMAPRAGTAIERMNICTGQRLPSFPVSNALAVRALADGGAVAGTLDGQLVFLDASGSTVRTIDMPLVQTIAFDADPRYVWVAFYDSIREFAKVDLRSGRIVLTIPNASDLGRDWWYPHDLAVYGETRPTLGGILPADVPALSPWFLLALGAVLATIALRAAA